MPNDDKNNNAKLYHTFTLLLHASVSVCNCLCSCMENFAIYLIQLLANAPWIIVLCCTSISNMMWRQCNKNYFGTFVLFGKFMIVINLYQYLVILTAIGYFALKNKISKHNNKDHFRPCKSVLARTKCATKALH